MAWASVLSPEGATKEWGLDAMAMLRAKLEEIAHASMIEEGAIRQTNSWRERSPEPEA